MSSSQLILFRGVGIPPTRIIPYIWANYNDLTVLPHWKSLVNKGNDPQMAARFRLVNYYNLPRYMKSSMGQVSLGPLLGDVHLKYLNNERCVNLLHKI